MIDETITPRYDVASWSETRWNGCWNAEAGVGLYLHAGRHREDLDMWWAQVVAYLPGGELCVERVWGRSTNPAGVTIGGFDLTMTEGGWRATNDSVGELTTTAALALAPRGASAPVRSFSFDVEAVAAAAPVWDMFAGSSERQDFAGDSHIQHSFTTTGTLRVGDAEYRLDGIGFKDHSSGVRDFTRWHAHRFFVIVAGGWTCHAVVMYGPDGAAQPPMGAFFRDGEQPRRHALRPPAPRGLRGRAAPRRGRHRDRHRRALRVRLRARARLPDDDDHGQPSTSTASTGSPRTTRSSSSRARAGWSRPTDRSRGATTSARRGGRWCARRWRRRARFGRKRRFT